MVDLNWLELLRHYDFCGLEQMGAPSDEYECEAKRISETCNSCGSEEELADLLFKVMKDCRLTLATDDKAEYQKAAREIWPLLVPR